MRRGTVADVAAAFGAGWRLIRANTSLVLPVLVFVVFEHVISPNGSESSLTGEIIAANVLIVLGAYLNLKYTVIAFLLLTVKCVSVYFTNADMYRALSGRHGGVKETFSILSYKGLARYGLFTLAWYGLFAVIGVMLSIVVYSAVVDVVHANIIIAGVFILLFPLFYAGLSIVAFVDVAVRAGETIKPVDAALATRLYVFYVVRSVIDIAVVFVLPICLAAVNIGYVTKVAVLVIALAVFVAYMRSVAVNFKYDCLLVRGGSGMPVRIRH